ncbi:MAG: RHS repeat-associated core domain-containing protein [Bryobacterales bacterium]|nr:RHS repeat-associated core domain-containing protein [Bryobacterales bacterium]
MSSGATAYVSAVMYADHGAVKEMRLNGYRMREKVTFDPQRLQPTAIAVEHCTDNQAACVSPSALLTLGYGYSVNAGGGPDNNGNPRWQDITVPGQWTARQNYTYDAWNRLSQFTEGTKSETYCYDEHGNRAMLGVSLPMWVPSVDTCTKTAVASKFPANRWSLMGIGYDAGGGMTSDMKTTYRYDVEDRVVQSWPSTTPSLVTQYGYDGEGRRVSMKVASAAAVVYVYDAFGQMAVEYGGSGTVGTHYLHTDHLGSTRLVTDGTVARRMDYTPFGVELTSADTPYRTAGLGYAVDGLTRLKFTGKERDFETGLDYFGARYMSSAQGRFTTPDTPMLAQHPSEPQSWNLYSYTANNPLSRIDPDGRNWFEINGQWQWHEGSDVNDKGEACKKGTKGCHHSDYTHLLVFQKTGTNREGAATGTLTLYGNDRGRAIMSSQIFSGGHGAEAAGEGKYRINLGRLETLTARDILTGIGENGLRYGYLGPHYGVQELPESLMGAASPWGSIRARLNEWVAGALGVPENMKGLFLHGSRDRLDYTNGCLCERSENILRWIRDTAKNKTPGVFPTIPVLVRR